MKTKIQIAVIQAMALGLLLSPSHLHSQITPEALVQETRSAPVSTRKTKELLKFSVDEYTGMEDPDEDTLESLPDADQDTDKSSRPTKVSDRKFKKISTPSFTDSSANRKVEKIYPAIMHSPNRTGIIYETDANGKKIVYPNDNGSFRIDSSNVYIQLIERSKKLPSSPGWKAINKELPEFSGSGRNNMQIKKKVD